MNSDSHTAAKEPESGSVRTLLQELRAETSQLLRQEVDLAKAEIGEKASRLGGHVTRLGVGGFIAYAGLIVLLFGLGDLATMLLIQAGVDPAMSMWIGRLSVGLIVALIGWMMLSRARQAMKSDDLVPEKTLQTLRDNKEWMQTKLQHSHESL